MQHASTLLSAARTFAAATLLSVVALGAHAAPAVTPLVDGDWLEGNLGRDDVIVLDIRSESNGHTQDAYLDGHIPGAIRSPYPGNWRTDRDGVTGVIPSVEQLEAYLSEIGVADGKAVVVVPAGTSSSDFGAAARIYWTLKQVGHDEVAILDGGHAAWVAEDRPLKDGEVTPVADMFIAEPRAELLATTEEVESKIGSDALLLDARPAPFFEGKERHPAMRLFGRLPGARNLDHDTLYDQAANKVRSPDELASIVPADFGDKSAEIVSYCNTGHWAATNWFVLSEVLGYENVTLYDDSMVGWTQNPDHVVESDRTRLDDLKDWIRGITG